MIKQAFYLILFTLCYMSLVVAQDLSLYGTAMHQSKHGSMAYRVMYPANYDESKQYPLILFLHGAGERGNDNKLQLTHGANFFIDNNRVNYPAIVVLPQCPEGGYWSNVVIQTEKGKRIFKFGEVAKPTLAMEQVQSLVHYWLQSGKIDKNRVYVGGLSMGGMGTFELLWRMPKTFAAAFPVCGGGDPKKAKKYSESTAVWIFHGAKDNVVPVAHSTQMRDALKAAHADVKYTEYPEANHNSWDNVFQETELMPWLMGHSLAK